jgi:hypothetical protein
VELLDLVGLEVQVVLAMAVPEVLVVLGTCW